MANQPLIEARRMAHLSQDGLAREIRLAGWRHGDPNGCTREMVHKWERGTVRRPHPRYLLLLENVLGQPAGSLGFDAGLNYGMNRAQALAGAGLDQEMFPLPDTADLGPMAGIWRSSYSFASSGRDAGFTSRHFVLVLQYGARLMVRSLQRQASAVSMDLSVNGEVITGTWTERTSGSGYYRGAVYTGAVQMLETRPGAMAGRWVGFGKEGEINDGPWSLDLVEASATQEAAERLDHPLPAEVQSGSAA
jgi:transcriptional regulator with XRE-family HTH domain